MPSEVNPQFYPEPELSREEAAYEVIANHEKLGQLNPFGQGAFDLGMRAALTYMLTGQISTNLDGSSHLALRYIRERAVAPGDMSIWAVKRFRQALEDTANQIAPENFRFDDGQAIVEQRSKGGGNHGLFLFGDNDDMGFIPTAGPIIEPGQMIPLSPPFVNPMLDDPPVFLRGPNIRPVSPKTGRLIDIIDQ